MKLVAITPKSAGFGGVDGSPQVDTPPTHPASTVRRQVARQ